MFFPRGLGFSDLFTHILFVFSYYYCVMYEIMYDITLHLGKSTVAHRYPPKWITDVYVARIFDIIIQDKYIIMDTLWKRLERF